MAHLVNKKHLETVINNLEGLSDFQKQHIKERWLAMVVRWDNRAAECKWKYFLLRSIVVIGGVALPALIGSTAMPTLINIKGSQVNTIQWVAFGLSLLVGVAAALEGLFRHGEIWRDKRAAEEMLSSEGWRYFERIGSKYKGMTHSKTYAEFALTIEDMIVHEIKGYLLVTHEKVKLTEQSLEDN
jgi:hypothetical protein